MPTLSVIKADTGGYVGHSGMHPEMIEVAQEAVTEQLGGLLIDARIGWCGDDLALIMTHDRGPEAEEIHRFAWDVFQATTTVAKRLGLHDAGEMMDYLRRHGPFEPHRLSLDEMEYTTMPAVGERLADRWVPLGDHTADERQPSPDGHVPVAGN